MSNETSVNRKRGTFYVNYDADAAVASSVTSRDVFLSRGAWLVVNVSESHGVASASGTVAVRKITDASAANAAAGATVIEQLQAALSTATTANTPQAGTLAVSLDARTLKPGDRLSLNFAGTATGLAGCLVQIELQPANKYGG